MKKCNNIYKALVLAVGTVLLSSCIYDHALKNIGEDVTLEMSFATKAEGTELKGEELVGIEGEVNTLRIFIFLDERNDRRLAGHYYTTAPVLAPTTIKMDMSVFREESQKVKFYVIANEKAMLDKRSTPVSLSDKTTEEQLKALSFTGIDKTMGLPMFDIKTATINVSGGTVVTADGAHKDHLALDAKIDFVLQRPMAKLTVYAAKSLDTSDDTTLKVTKVTMTKGYAASNGLFAPVNSPDLGSTSLKVRDVACAKLGATNTWASTDAERTDRTNRNNFTQVTESIYPFENAAGSNDWQTAVTDGAQLEIVYAFDGTPQKGIINLPPITRNEHIVVNCVMIGNGTMEITLTTLPWDYNERVWDYTKDVTFSQAIVWDSNTTWDNTEKVVIAKSQEITFSFDIDTPVNATWYATLIPMSNAQSAFKFKNADGTYSKTVSGTIVTTDEPVSLTIWHDDDNQVDTDKALLRVSVKTDAGVTVVHLGTTDVPEYTIIRNK